MQLSCLPVSFFTDIIEGRMSVAEWARMGAEIGLDGIDLSILFVPDRSLKTAAQFRHDIEGAGIRVAMMSTYPDFTHPDAAQREKELVLEQQAVAVAAELGADLVRVTDGQAHPETGREEGIKWAAEGLTRLVETTAHLGVTLAFENHAKPGAWEYTDFSQSPDIFLKIVDATADTGLGVNFDVGNAATFSDDPVALLDKVLNRVVSIHASDSAEHGVLKHVLLGTGITPYPEMFARFKRADWDGWVIMEEASFLGRKGVEMATKFIRDTWSAA